MASPAVLPASGLMTRISLSVSLAGLPNLDNTSRTDACVKCALIHEKVGFTELGTTEVVKDDLNPRFSTPIFVDYHFEEVQTLRFWVVDVDKKSGDNIGEYNCTLGDIVGSRGQQLTGILKVSVKGYGEPRIIIRAEEVKGANQTVRMQFAGSHLDSTHINC